MPYYIGATDHDVLHREHSRCRKFRQLQRDQHAFFEPALHYWRRAQNYWLYCAVPVIFYDHNLMLHGYTASFASWDIVITLLTSVVIPCQLQLRTLYTRNFADVYTHIYIVNYDLRLLMMFKHITTCFANWVQTQQHLLTPCVNYSPPPFHLHSYTIFFGWLSSPMSHIAVILTKRRLAMPTSSANLLLPPIHATRCKQRLGIWLKQWVADHQQLFPSLFIPKIRVIETRSATLGDRLFTYIAAGDKDGPLTLIFVVRALTSLRNICFMLTHMPSSCLISSQCSQIDSDVMAASMKDQSYGSTEKLLDQLRQKIRRLAC